MNKQILILMTTFSVLSAQAQIKYPQTPRDNTVDEYFGVKVADPYRWLENDTSAATAQWVEAENEVTNAYLARIPFRGKLLKRLKEVANYEKVGTPFKKHGRWYLYKNNGLQNQSVLYTMDRLDGEQRVFLDPNTLSTDGTVALKGCYFSHDGKYMAYAISRSGSDWQEFYVMDVKTGQLLNDHIEWAKFSGAAWQGDGFYYSSYDAPAAGKEFSNVNEVQKIYYHKMGTPQREDVLFYQNPAYPKRFYSVSVNKEETVMFLFESGERQGNHLYVRDLRQPNSQFIQMTSSMDYEYSPVEVMGDKILILTNEGAPKNRLMVANLKKPGIRDWEELVGEEQDVLTDVTVIADKMVLTYSKDASDHPFVYSLDGKRIREVKLPSVGSVGFSGERGEPECFYAFTSFTVPGTIYQYDLQQDKSTLFAAPKVNFNLNGYTTEQVFYPSKDGTRIPMFLTYKKGLKRNGKNPVYLYGYGGFNISLPPGFSSSRIPFLEAGGIYAQANLRGGSEYGEAWHLAGTKMQKQHVFDDLLVGACMTQRPDLFRVCVPEVGVMDMLRYHKFTIGWNWAPDYGTSEDSKEMFEYLRGYSPLHNLREGVSYPATLVTTADHDDRVVPAHSFKFAATLQACQAGSEPVLIRIDSKAGHGGGKPLSKQLEEQADIYGFIMYHTGMKYKK